MWYKQTKSFFLFSLLNRREKYKISLHSPMVKKKNGGKYGAFYHRDETTFYFFFKGHRSRQSPYTCGPYIRTGSGAPFLFNSGVKIKMKGERYGYHRRA